MLGRSLFDRDTVGRVCPNAGPRLENGSEASLERAGGRILAVIGATAVDDEEPIGPNPRARTSLSRLSLPRICSAAFSHPISLNVLCTSSSPSLSPPMVSSSSSSPSSSASKPPSTPGPSADIASLALRGFPSVAVSDTLLRSLLAFSPPSAWGTSTSPQGSSSSGACKSSCLGRGRTLPEGVRSAPSSVREKIELARRDVLEPRDERAEPREKTVPREEGRRTVLLWLSRGRGELWWLLKGWEEPVGK